MTTRADYTVEVETIASKITKELGIEFHWTSYSGGVPGMVSNSLPAEMWSRYKNELTKLFGEPEVVTPWHPDHTKGIPPLKFRITPSIEHMKASHVQLIHKMQRRDKQHCIISMM